MSKKGKFAKIINNDLELTKQEQLIEDVEEILEDMFDEEDGVLEEDIEFLFYND